VPALKVPDSINRITDLNNMPVPMKVQWGCRLGDFRNWLMTSGEAEIIKILMKKLLKVIF
jgi:hypothetical protein